MKTVDITSTTSALTITIDGNTAIYPLNFEPKMENGGVQILIIPFGKFITIYDNPTITVNGTSFNDSEGNADFTGMVTALLALTVPTTTTP